MKIILWVLIAFIGISVLSVCLALNKQKHLNNYKELYKGMTLNHAIKLMGGGFTKEEKAKYDSYTWTIDSKYYKGVNKVVIHVGKDGTLEDIQTFKV